MTAQSETDQPKTVHIRTKHGWEEWAANDPRVRAYDALYTAAQRMGWGNYKAQLAVHVKAGRAKSTFRFYVTDEHANVTKAMPDVLEGVISPEEAMALLNEYDVVAQRLRG